jgi:CHAT domain-containing protein/Tfp pilus assembly protein PilF
MKRLFLIFLPVEIIALIIGIMALVVHVNADLIQANDYFTQGNEAFQKNDFDGAIKNYTQAISIKPKIAAYYYNRARAYIIKGEIDKVFEDCTRAIQLDSKLAEAYGLLGTVYDFRGQHDKAIDNYSRALQLKPELKEYYTDRGNAYISKGEYDLAIEDYNRRLAIDPDEVLIIYNRGLAYEEKKEYDRALKDIDRALELSPRNRDIRNAHALIYLHSAQYEKALEEYNGLIGMSPNFAMAYANRGLAYWNLKNYNRAAEDFSLSLMLDPGLFSAYFYRGRAYEAMGFPAWAQLNYKLSLEKAEQDSNIRNLMRAASDLAQHIYKDFRFLTGMSKDMTGDTVRRGLALAIDRMENIRYSGARGPQFMLDYLNLYYAGVDFEIFFDNTGKAFDYSEALRSRGFLDQMGVEVALQLDGLDPNDVLKVRNLLDEIGDCQNILNSYKGKTVEAEKKFVDAGQRLENAETQLAALEEQIALCVPRYAELRRPPLVSADKAMTFCGEERVILEYVLWDNSKDSNMSINSYCLVVGKDGVSAVKLDPQYNYAEMTNTLRRKILEEDEPSFEDERKSLYATLIQPVLHKIPATVKEILIVPDGNLAYLPFDILKDSEGIDLGEKYSISISPSVSVSEFAARNGNLTQEPFIAFGGAWYSKKKKTADRSRDITILPDDRRRTQNTGLDEAGDYYRKRFVWPDLPGTELEVKGLGEISANSTILLGKNVTEAKVKELSRSGELARYPVIHFACHGYFNSEAPILSGLVMSEVSGRLSRNNEDGYLTIPEMAVLNLNANMVILSACETGRGEIIRGDGMVGLARSLLVAGTRSVGVSLWSINDKPTVDFMLSVYNKALREGKTFRAAYFETKQQFRKSGPWKHPRYWAGFTLYE